MTVAFLIIAVVTVAGAVAAMSLRNLVHCVLALTVAFAGLAAAYLQLNAPFVGFAQILVYIGAVAILVVFAILLTRGSEPSGRGPLSGSAIAGVGIGALVFGVLTAVVIKSGPLNPPAASTASPTVRQIGTELMGRYVLPLEVIGLLLTAALIGAVLIALNEKEKKE